MSDLTPLQLPLNQSFELEKMYRVIDSTTDVAKLQELCKDALQAWHWQKAATAWVMRQSL